MKLWITLLCIFNALQVFAAQEVDGRYIVETKEEAISTMVTDGGDLKHFIRPNKALLKYQKIEELIDSFFPRLKQITKQENLPRPIVILVTDEGQSVAVSKLIDEGKATLASNIVTIKIELFKNEPQLLGVLTHEVAHYALKHGEIHDEDEIKTSYNSQETSCLDCLFTTDANEIKTKRIKELYSSTQMLSRVNAQEFNNIPLSPYASLDEGETFASLLYVLLDNARAKDNKQECHVAFKTLKDLLLFQSENINFAEQSFKVKSSQTFYYKNMTNLLISQSDACLLGEDALFDQVLKRFIGVDKQIVSELYASGKYSDDPTITEAFQEILSNKTIIQKVRSLVRITEQDIEASKTTIKDFEHTRYLSTEDEADEVAMKTLAHTAEPFALYSYLLRETYASNRKTCIEKVDKDIEPNFGFILDKHHSPCWRLWRAKQVLKNYLAK